MEEDSAEYAEVYTTSKAAPRSSQVKIAVVDEQNSEGYTCRESAPMKPKSTGGSPARQLSPSKSI